MTPAQIRSLKKGRTITDKRVRGLELRGGAEGHTWRYRYRIDGRARTYRIGRYPEIGLSKAREIAGSLATSIARGQDPQAERERASKGATVADLIARALEEHWRIHAKPRTLATLEGRIKKHILPKLGRVPLHALTMAEVASWHVAIGRKGKGKANRALANLSKACSLGVQWGWLEANPCKGVQRFREKPKDRYLTPDEYARLSLALQDAADAGMYMPAIGAIGLIMLTGLRHGEVLDLRWEDLDRARGIIHLRDTKTGGRSQRIAPEAWRILDGLDRVGPWVFASRVNHTKRIYSLAPYWKRIRKAAGLEGVRIHDLRHSFATSAAAAGYSLTDIGAALGHRSTLTTQRYAHATDRVQRELVLTVAAEIVSHAKDKKPGDPK